MKRKITKSILCLMMVLSLLIAPVSASASSNVAVILRVKGDWVRLHEDPDGGGDVITRLRKGAKVLYWGSHEDDMYKVLTSSGKTGYIYKGYVSVYGAMKKSQIYITTATTQLYKRSGSKLKKNGTLAKGKYLVVYKTSGDWAYIKTMSGKGAYIKKGTVERAF